MLAFLPLFLFQRTDDRDHKVKIAVGNGLRMDVWTEFQERFGIEQVIEFYAATEGNAAFINTFNKRGAIGRASPIAVSITFHNN